MASRATSMLKSARAAEDISDGLSFAASLRAAHEYSDGIPAKRAAPAFEPLIVAMAFRAKHAASVRAAHW